MTTDSSEIDALFRLPLGEFTAARNALAAKLKNAGQEEDADRVRGLAKPPVSAWAVNQLYWQHRKPFERLLAAGDRLRTAQASQLRGKGGELHEPIEARRTALSELTQQAATVLRESGHTPSPDLMRRIMTTLEALATYGSDAAGPTAGRLTGDIDAPGFEALASLVDASRANRSGRSAAGRRPNRVLPFVSQKERTAAREKLSPAERKQQEEAERRARIAEAATAVREAERSLADARKSAAQAEATLKKAAARAKETKKIQDALAARMEKAAADAEKTRDEARRVAAEAEEAAQAVADAERVLEEARRAHQSLTD